ncbi:hypothetical protein V490_01025 [Pseudogymnoascus sp. VKM F-3557]|nr:hypothetical protein V490_01025 [Pseudogymnoascus sp. VKM F-3557]
MQITSTQASSQLYLPAIPHVPEIPLQVTLYTRSRRAHNPRSLPRTFFFPLPPNRRLIFPLLTIPQSASRITTPS